MKKTRIYIIVGLLTPLIFLAGCGKESRPSLEERIGESDTLQTGSYEGVIERLETLDVYQQGSHKLITEDDGTIIIQSPSIDLNRYLDEEVLVKGVMEKGIGDAKDVFTVNQISYVDESRAAGSKDYENKSFGFKLTHPSNWLSNEGQNHLKLNFEENEIVQIEVFSDESDLDSFAASKEEGESTEVTIGAQRALRYASENRMTFYVPNPPKKKIYQIQYYPQDEDQLELFYDLLDSFEIIFLSQGEGEACGGLEQIKCPEEHICQLESDGKYAEGTCVPIGGESMQTSCPFIAPPSNCNQYRISEFSPKGCPSRYECVEDGTGVAPASFRDLNVVEAGIQPEDYEPPEDSDSVDEKDDKEDSEVNAADYEVPDLSEVTYLYVNERKGFSLLMPRSWYFASFGPVDGSLWKVGFANFGLEENEEAIITMTLTDEAGGKAFKKVDDLFFTFDGPSDLKGVMEKMADSVELTE